MVAKTREVAKVALALPPRLRAQLAEKLLESLDDPGRRDLDALWAREVENRVNAFENGELKSVPAKEVFGSLKARRK